MAQSPLSSPTLTTYELLRQHGVSRRDFLNFCAVTAASLGLDAQQVPAVVAALETKPRLPVIWLHGLECTCCSESFLRSSHPIAQDVVLNMISLDYDDTLQAAAGEQVEQIRRDLIAKAKRGEIEYVLAVEGNAPTKDGGVYCTVAGEAFLDVLRETAEHAKGDRRYKLRFGPPEPQGHHDHPRLRARQPATAALGTLAID